MRIGLNLLYLKSGRVGGTEIYARELIAAMARKAEGFEFVVFLNRQADGIFEELGADRRFKMVSCDAPSSSWARHLWEQARFPRMVREHGVDLLHSLAYVSPLRPRCAKVVTVHDMIYKVSGSSIGWARRLFWKFMVPRSARACDALITPSENARRDVLKFLPTAPEQVCAIWLGKGQSWPQSVEWESVKTRYSLPDSFFLAVGAMPHKRLDLVKTAVRKLNQERGLNLQAVVTGHMANGRNGDGALQQIGYVLPAELRALYARATALLCVSDLEGFGLPVLEAMSLGTPVIAARRGSLPEVVGEAGILVDHGDPDALSEAMWQVLSNPELRMRLSEQGMRRAQRFSWEDCAHKTLQVYRSVLAGRVGRA